MEAVQGSVGKKIVMAVTGILMVLFVIAHMIGNMTIFAGLINAYAEHLRHLPLLLWSYRAVMIAALLFHSIIGVRLSMENLTTRSGNYAMTRHRSVTFAGETMIWSGILLLAFIVYHLLHFTFRVTNPDISNALDSAGRPDVSRMVILSFHRTSILVVYSASMVLLYLHLSHGIQSFIQTLGCNSGKTLPTVRRAGVFISVILFAGFVAVPLSVIFGLLRV
jgi:succinate dehydrogenase / fumarate reductase, cytochrome b subunit